MKFKINENLKYREYNDTIVFIPEGENCFIVNEIAYDIYNNIRNGYNIEEIKKILIKKYSQKYSLEIILNKIDNLIGKMLEKYIILEITT